ncbi:MAG: hypothetical protein JO023_29515, partial [Chloroflexi bacterium]|nr:hypothetical protein [Chloroflexota bacterium]
MNRLARMGVLPCVLALAGLTASFASAFADFGVTTAYEIESKQQYCASGGTDCVPQNGRPNLDGLRFAMVELDKFTPSSQDPAGGSVSMPDVLLAKCAGPHWMDARGNIHAPTMFVYVGPSNMGLNGGTIRGDLNLSRARETDTNSVATLSFSATDPVSGDRATVTGTQVANNTINQHVSGGFNVALDGQQFDEIVAGP